MHSFVVADLHAHLINLPIVLLFLAGLVAVVSRSQESRIKNQGTKIRWWEVGILGWLLGIFAMTNAWDVPIYGLVAGVTLLVLGIMNYKLRIKKDWKVLFDILKRLMVIGGALIGITLLTSLPFQLNFEQIAQGVLPVNATSEFSKLLVLWGWDLFLFLSLLIFVIGKVKSKNEKFKNISIWDWVVLAWYGVGWLLVIIPEFIYVKDIYIADYHRANTMFKLVYQSWVLFAIGGSYTIVRLTMVWFRGFEISKFPSFAEVSAGRRSYKLVWLGLVVLGLVAVGSYPRFAIKGYYGGLKDYKGLDGEVWLARKYPDDYAGIVWLRDRVQEFRSSGVQEGGNWAPVVLEAVGDSYTEFDRVSAYTGYPTIEGWLVHEWLWRRSYDEPGARAAEVEKVYLSEDIVEVRKILSKYGVDYVFVGDKEREKYALLNESKFEEMGDMVFESGETRVYRIQ